MHHRRDLEKCLGLKLFTFIKSQPNAFLGKHHILKIILGVLILTFGMGSAFGIDVGADQPRFLRSVRVSGCGHGCPFGVPDCKDEQKNLCLPDEQQWCRVGTVRRYCKDRRVEHGIQCNDQRRNGGSDGNDHRHSKRDRKDVQHSSFALNNGDPGN